MNYANTTTYKAYLTRSNSSQLSNYVEMGAGLWRSTSAINSIKLYLTSGGNFVSGFTATIYGITAA